jgi:uncharacterized protein (TIGR02145 family)
MKKTSYTSLIILLVFQIFLLHSCKKDKHTPPVLTTIAVTEISYTSAISGGNVTNEGGASVISRGICWNTSADPTILHSKTIESPGMGAFISNITQITPNTKYFVRAYATNSAGTGYGNPVTFTSLSVEVPVLITAEITSITQITAVSGGNITDDKGGSVTARGVCWGISENPTISDSKTSDASGIGIFASSLTGLIGNTSYYVRAYATNSAGTQYGNQVNFKTSPLMPAIATETVSSISLTSSNSGGTISNDGGAPVTSRGVCWSTSQKPTITDSKTDNGTGTGIFNSSVNGLTANTTYYIRAYATNSAGTAYGNERSFKTYAANDIEGNLYNSVTIGTQTWLSENLKTTRFNDNSSIPLVSDSITWLSLTSPAYCWYKNDESNNKVTYGALYNWYTVNTGKLCPIGWHVPTSDEFTTLTNFLGGIGAAGGKIKEVGTDHWLSPNTSATNESGFTALPAGQRGAVAEFVHHGMLATFWTSTPYNIYKPWYRCCNHNTESVFVGNGSLNSCGFSIRCIKD